MTQPQPAVTQDWTAADGAVTLLRTYQSWYVAAKNPHEALQKTYDGKASSPTFRAAQTDPHNVSA